MRKMKDSGVEWIGEIPEKWEVTRIKNLFVEINDRYDSKEEVTLLSVSEYYGVAPRAEKIDKSEMLTHAASLEGYKICKQNDIVINIMLAWKSSLGVSAYRGIVSPAYCVYRAKVPLYPRYYHYLFRTNVYACLFKQYSTGIIDSRLRLYTEKFFQLISHQPPLHEQRVIADFLDRKCAQIDAIIIRQQDVIEKLKLYKQSVITEAVTKGLDPDVPMKDSGIEWIGKMPVTWSVYKFFWGYNAMLGKMLDAKRIKGDKLHPYIKNADVQWSRLNIDNLDEMDFEEDEKERYMVKPGDLLICEGGEIGKSAIVPDEFPEGIYYQKALHRVRSRTKSKTSILFLYYVILCMAKNGCLNTSPEKATIAHLPGDALNQLRIPFPQILEQKQIVQYLSLKCSQIEAIILNKQTLIDKLTQYKKSLIYEAVTGKLEV